jgi:hypothetical protein
MELDNLLVRLLDSWSAQPVYMQGRRTCTEVARKRSIKPHRSSRKNDLVGEDLLVAKFDDDIREV